jgi:hypothetical protein
MSMSANNFCPRGVTLTRTECEELRHIANTIGDRTISVSCGISRTGLARAIGGLHCNPGTVYMIRDWLNAHRESAK